MSGIPEDRVAVSGTAVINGLSVDTTTIDRLSITYEATEVFGYDQTGRSVQKISFVLSEPYYNDISSFVLYVTEEGGVSMEVTQEICIEADGVVYSIQDSENVIKTVVDVIRGPFT